MTSCRETFLASTALVTPNLEARLRRYGIHVGNDNEASAGVLGNGRRHDSNRSGASNQHIFAEQVEGKRRMNRITKRVETGKNVQRESWDPLTRHWSGELRDIRQKRPAD